MPQLTVTYKRILPKLLMISIIGVLVAQVLSIVTPFDLRSQEDFSMVSKIFIGITAKLVGNWEFYGVILFIGFLKEKLQQALYLALGYFLFFTGIDTLYLLYEEIWFFNVVHGISLVGLYVYFGFIGKTIFQTKKGWWLSIVPMILVATQSSYPLTKEINNLLSQLNWDQLLEIQLNGEAGEYRIIYIHQVLLNGLSFFLACYLVYRLIQFIGRNDKYPISFSRIREEDWPPIFSSILFWSLRIFFISGMLGISTKLSHLSGEIHHSPFFWQYIDLPYGIASCTIIALALGEFVSVFLRKLGKPNGWLFLWLNVPIVNWILWFVLQSRLKEITTSSNSGFTEARFDTQLRHIKVIVTIILILQTLVIPLMTYGFSPYRGTEEPYFPIISIIVNGGVLMLFFNHRATPFYISGVMMVLWGAANALGEDYTKGLGFPVGVISMLLFTYLFHYKSLSFEGFESSPDVFEKQISDPDEAKEDVV